MKKQLQFNAIVRLIMRVSLLQIILLGCLITLGYAKDLSAQILEKKVTLDCQDTPLRKALLKIEKATDASFVYQSHLISSQEKITLQTSDESLEMVLRKIFTPLGITYEADGNQIILSKQIESDKINKDESRSESLSSDDIFIATITGKVIDELNNPLPGVNVLVKGTTNGTTTDSEGVYSLAVTEENSILIFSFIGYTTQEVSVGNQTQINVTLMPDILSLQEVVVVGYGTQKKVNLTGAVASVKGEDITKRPVTNAATMLQGTMPGVQIVQNSGEPGNERVSIRIRGNGTFSGAGSDPLVLIDGVPGSFSNLNPINIESISVLKDAASASIYGARAANGVILVTTKTGKEGKISLQYNGNYAIHTPTKLFDLVTN